MSDTHQPGQTGGRDGRTMMADTRAAEDLVATRPSIPMSDQTPVGSVQAEIERQQAFAAEMQRGPKVARLGGIEYPCAEEIPALLFAELMDRQAALTGTANDDSAPRGDRIRAAVAILDYFVLDDSLEEIRARCSSKTDPIGFPEIMAEIGRLLPVYSGAELGKASG